MAPELKGANKRKAVPATSPQAKKTKTAKPEKKVAQKKAVNAPAAAARRAPRKTAAHSLSDPESPEEDGGWDKLNQDAAKGKKKPKKPAAKKDAAKVAVKEKKVDPKPELKPELENADAAKIPLNIDGPDTDSEESEEENDQTAMLLRGFESSDEEGEAEAEAVDPKALAKAGIPDEKRVKKKLEKLSGRQTTTPGIVYLGRIPHGFYEHEMRSYFSQFGTVSRLRLSRNKKTGASKHYAFLEFTDEDVAQIVADTMNNYLLFGHILKCKVVPRDNLEYVESLFKGANQRYKPRPHAKLARHQFEKKKPEEVWMQKVDAENRRRKKINARLSAKGIEYEFDAPQAKKAEKAVELAGDTPPVELAGDTPAVEETSVGKPAGEPPVEKPAEELPVGKSAGEFPVKKKAVAKKGKKAANEAVDKFEEPAPAAKGKAAPEPKAEKKKGKKEAKSAKPAAEKPTEKKMEKKTPEKSTKKAKKGATAPAKKVAEIETITAAPIPDAEIEVEENTTTVVVEKSPVAVKKNTTKTKKSKKAAGKG